jgi:4-amino-4-deoxy-L-arabinose transferase-like glycosyltransferase
LSRPLQIASLLAFVALWLVTLGGRSLLSPDEGRYATLALGMLQSGDWVTPRLNGLLYFEKPPLQYWAGAASLWLFGINEFAARLWSGLAGLATVLLVAHTASRLWGREVGLQALLIAGSTTWIALNAHFLSLDAGLTAALTLVLCALLLAEHPGEPEARRRRWMLAAWAGIGLAVLSKGLIGILIPGAVLVLHSLWRLDFSLWRRLRWLAGLALALSITLPWFVLVSMRNPDFARFFFIHEHFERYLTTEHHREGAWWYFVPVLLVGALPWTSALPWALRARRSDFATSLALVWALFVFVFFSLSGSKLQSYILPMFPALALLLARALGNATARHARLQVRQQVRWHLLLPAVLWVAALAASPQFDRIVDAATPQAAAGALARGVAIAAVIGLAGTGLAVWLLRHAHITREHITRALAAMAAGHLLAVFTVVGSYDTYGQLKSGATIARAIAPYVDAATPMYSVRSYEQTLPFYLRRTLTLVDYRDEFEFGETHEPDRWIPTLEAFALRWQQEPRAAAYMTRDTLAVLRARGLAMRVIFEDPRRLVVVKP